MRVILGINRYNISNQSKQVRERIEENFHLMIMLWSSQISINLLFNISFEGVECQGRNFGYTLRGMNTFSFSIKSISWSSVLSFGKSSSFQVILKTYMWIKIFTTTKIISSGSHPPPTNNSMISFWKVFFNVSNKNIFGMHAEIYYLYLNH